MNFSEALTILKQGGSVTRHKWNIAKETKEFIFIATGEPVIIRSTSSTDWGFWVPEQEDILADDWYPPTHSSSMA